MRPTTVSDGTSLRLKAIGVLLSLFVGAALATLGLLPWLITGMRLLLQNLWAVQTPPEQMPIALLPFSQYALTLLVAMIVMGSGLAGCFARATRANLGRSAPGAITVGVVVVQAIAVVQTTLTLSRGLSETSTAELYLTALVAGTVAAILIGILVLLLIARPPKAGAAVGLSIAGVLAGAWLGGIILPFGTVATDSHTVLLGALRWLPAIIVGLAVVWCGFGTSGKLFAVVGSLLVLWIGPAAFTAISAAAGTRVLAGRPAEMAAYGAQVFGGALGFRGGSLALVVLAVIVVVLGIAMRRLDRRRRPVG
ncbi:hypothetical protein LVY72_09685 [Arthrobacter sp. I2-34]|uniref:Integral membrane protein n=1 Tax=Arthrobacter hankyongi TaxID=2904801 RepID=A0ABS9L6Q4_9MICC|nr:hypothetical protein [Arthrobacter hankyongi]MCG2622188.1 hypothetical protein [Arthrobacter hankyongi]